MCDLSVYWTMAAKIKADMGHIKKITIQVKSIKKILSFFSPSWAQLVSPEWRWITDWLRMKDSSRSTLKWVSEYLEMVNYNSGPWGNVIITVTALFYLNHAQFIMAGNLAWKNCCVMYVISAMVILTPMFHKKLKCEKSPLKHITAVFMMNSANSLKSES